MNHFFQCSWLVYSVVLKLFLLINPCIIYVSVYRINLHVLAVSEWMINNIKHSDLTLINDWMPLHYIQNMHEHTLQSNT